MAGLIPVISRAAAFAALAAVVFVYAGPARAASLVEEVNADDKSFSGVWIHRVKTPGQGLYSVMARVKVDVSGRKFRLVDSEGRFEAVYDGEVFWHLLPSAKEARHLETDGSARLPFWKMSDGMEPLLRSSFSGEEDVAGRGCWVLIADGKFEEGDVKLTYWIDKEKKVVLKKEYLLVVGDKVFVRESYESEEVAFGPAPREETFSPAIPPDWERVKKRSLKFGLLETKF
ncbi:MAG: hypothetical protein V3W31_09350 [Thermodesulfobacteriota bacterium]